MNLPDICLVVRISKHINESNSYIHQKIDSAIEIWLKYIAFLPKTNFQFPIIHKMLFSVSLNSRLNISSELMPKKEMHRKTNKVLPLFNFFILLHSIAQVVKLVDTPAWGAGVLTDVQVRVLSWALHLSSITYNARMAELVDALVSGTSNRKVVQVRALFRVLSLNAFNFIH